MISRSSQPQSSGNSYLPEQEIIGLAKRKTGFALLPKEQHRAISAKGGKVAKERGLSLYQREIEAVRGINQLLRGELADVRRQLQAQRVKYLALLEDYNHLAKENGNEK